MSFVSGLLTQKPDSPAPVEGSVARFSVEQKPKKSGEGTWNKIKNEKGDFGTAYKVVKVERKDDYTHPQHGTFHQFSILIEPSSQGDAGAVSNGAATPAPATSTNKDEEIARAVAFKGAVEVYCAGTNSANSAEDAARVISSLTDALLPVVKGESPTAPAQSGTTANQPAKTPEQIAAEDDSIPFAPSRI